jgi:general secretion pathway protein A
MYTSYYDLKEKPFNLLPDPDFFYMSSGHENAYVHIEYAVSENKGFVVVSGEIGAGKTTLINLLIKKIEQDVKIGLINNTSVTPEHLIKMVCSEYELDVDGMDKAEMLEVLHSFLLDQFSQRQRVILIIDEAQNLSVEVIEEIRMLSNIEADKHHLLQIFLLGQPELIYTLQNKKLKQFVQRITVYCHLKGLKREDTEKYITHRLNVAGNKQKDLFSKQAIDTIFKYSKGIPRIVNNICDTSLVYGFADQVKVINKEIVENVIKSRESDGIFLNKPNTKNSDNINKKDNFKKLISVLKSWKKHIKLLERRISLLEEKIDISDKKLDELGNKKDQKDEIIIELFKMLKKNMERQFRIAAHNNNSEIYINHKENKNQDFMKISNLFKSF